MGKPNSNLGASRYQKLKNYARAEKRPMMSVVDQYAFTGFLRRMSKTGWNDFFSLKGGMMMLVLTGENVRPTKDIDLDGPKTMTLEELKSAIHDIMNTDLEEDDGVTFHTDTVDVLKDRTEGLISGAKVRFDAQIGTARVKVNIDVGFENVVTPELRKIKLPTQLNDETEVNLNMYPVETSISEKFRAMIYYGKSNSRLKDFYDIQKFSEISEFDGEEVAEAIQKSCEKFGFQVPSLQEISALNPDNESLFSSQWSAFLKKNGIKSCSFGDCQDNIYSFLGPVVDYLNGDAPAPGYWSPDYGWEKENIFCP